MFRFTLRADGSDRFGKDNRFGFFPSGAFAWRVIEEEFMKRQSVLSNLKLRLSIGQTGNAEIGGNTYGYYGTTCLEMQWLMGWQKSNLLIVN